MRRKVSKASGAGLFHCSQVVHRGQEPRQGGLKITIKEPVSHLFLGSIALAMGVQIGYRDSLQNFTLSQLASGTI